MSLAIAKFRNYDYTFKEIIKGDDDVKAALKAWAIDTPARTRNWTAPFTIGVCHQNCRQRPRAPRSPTLATPSPPSPPFISFNFKQIQPASPRRCLPKRSQSGGAAGGLTARRAWSQCRPNRIAPRSLAQPRGDYGAARHRKGTLIAAVVSGCVPEGSNPRLCRPESRHRVDCTKAREPLHTDCIRRAWECRPPLSSLHRVDTR